MHQKGIRFDYDESNDELLLMYNFYRSGDPQRGLRYLNRAHDAGCEDEDLFVIRCQCHLRLGNFALADKVEFIESIAYDLITSSYH